MTYRKLLEEGRVWRVTTYTIPFYYWTVSGEKKLDREPCDWEDSFMTKDEAWHVYATFYSSEPFIRPNYCIERLTELAAREKPNDTRSINERKIRERTLPQYRPTHNSGLFKSLLPNILVGIPLMIIRSALKH